MSLRYGALRGGMSQAVRLQVWIISALCLIEVHVQLAAAALVSQVVAAFGPQ